ncbi:MAG: hypothetical protein LBH43_07675 [Treponema sp.]|jgi:hypothetical protein|nr:hypothetical protein [Treponema sp.]
MRNKCFALIAAFALAIVMIGCSDGPSLPKVDTNLSLMPDKIQDFSPASNYQGYTKEEIEAIIDGWLENLDDSNGIPGFSSIMLLKSGIGSSRTVTREPFDIDFAKEFDYPEYVNVEGFLKGYTSVDDVKMEMKLNANAKIRLVLEEEVGLTELFGSEDDDGISIPFAAIGIITGEANAKNIVYNEKGISGSFSGSFKAALNIVNTEVRKGFKFTVEIPLRFNLKSGDITLGYTIKAYQWGETTACYDETYNISINMDDLLGSILSGAEDF